MSKRRDSTGGTDASCPESKKPKLDIGGTPPLQPFEHPSTSTSETLPKSVSAIKEVCEKPKSPESSVTEISESVKKAFNVNISKQTSWASNYLTSIGANRKPIKIILSSAKNKLNTSAKTPTADAGVNSTLPEKSLVKPPGHSLNAIPLPPEKNIVTENNNEKNHNLKTKLFPVDNSDNGIPKQPIPSWSNIKYNPEASTYSATTSGYHGSIHTHKHTRNNVTDDKYVEEVEKFLAKINKPQSELMPRKRSLSPKPNECYEKCTGTRYESRSVNEKSVPRSREVQVDGYISKCRSSSPSAKYISREKSNDRSDDRYLEYKNKNYKEGPSTSKQNYLRDQVDEYKYIKSEAYKVKDHTLEKEYKTKRESNDDRYDKSYTVKIPKRSRDRSDSSEYFGETSSQCSKKVMRRESTSVSSNRSEHLRDEFPNITKETQNAKNIEPKNSLRSDKTKRESNENRYDKSYTVKTPNRSRDRSDSSEYFSETSSQCSKKVIKRKSTSISSNRSEHLTDEFPNISKEIQEAKDKEPKNSVRSNSSSSCEDRRSPQKTHKKHEVRNQKNKKKSSHVDGKLAKKSKNSKINSDHKKKYKIKYMKEMLEKLAREVNKLKAEKNTRTNKSTANAEKPKKEPIQETLTTRIEKNARQSNIKSVIHVKNPNQTPDLREKLIQKELSNFLTKLRVKNLDHKTIDNRIKETETKFDLKQTKEIKLKEEDIPKVKKYKKIKLLIKVCNSSESSNSDDDDFNDTTGNKESNSMSDDLSFLDDFNIDEIANSLIREKSEPEDTKPTSSSEKSTDKETIPHSKTTIKHDNKDKNATASEDKKKETILTFDLESDSDNSTDKKSTVSKVTKDSIHTIDLENCGDNITGTKYFASGGIKDGVLTFELESNSDSEKSTASGGKKDGILTFDLLSNSEDSDASTVHLDELPETPSIEDDDIEIVEHRIKKENCSNIDENNDTIFQHKRDNAKDTTRFEMGISTAVIKSESDHETGFSRKEIKQKILDDDVVILDKIEHDKKCDRNIIPDKEIKIEPGITLSDMKIIKAIQGNDEDGVNNIIPANKIKVEPDRNDVDTALGNTKTQKDNKKLEEIKNIAKNDIIPIIEIKKERSESNTNETVKTQENKNTLSNIEHSPKVKQTKKDSDNNLIPANKIKEELCEANTNGRSLTQVSNNTLCSTEVNQTNEDNNKDGKMDIVPAPKLKKNPDVCKELVDKRTQEAKDINENSGSKILPPNEINKEISEKNSKEETSTQLRNNEAETLSKKIKEKPSEQNLNTECISFSTETENMNQGNDNELDRLKLPGNIIFSQPPSATIITSDGHQEGNDLIPVNQINQENPSEVTVLNELSKESNVLKNTAKNNDHTEDSIAESDKGNSDLCSKTIKDMTVSNLTKEIGELKQTNVQNVTDSSDAYSVKTLSSTDLDTNKLNNTVLSKTLDAKAPETTVVTTEAKLSTEQKNCFIKVLKTNVKVNKVTDDLKQDKTTNVKSESKSNNDLKRIPVDPKSTVKGTAKAIVSEKQPDKYSPPILEMPHLNAEIDASPLSSSPAFRTKEKNFVSILEERMHGYLHERFTITSVIHRGKFSKIFHCRGPMNRDYAVKTRRDDLVKATAKEGMLAALQTVIPKENHSFVRIIDGLSVAGRWCYLMEYFPKNLSQALEENGLTFHVQLVYHLSKQLLDAVNTLGHYNIVHSDIKPGHVLLNSMNDKLKLCGLESAYYYKPEQQCLPNIGTINYRAPEIILGYPAVHNMDLWSTALVMFEMATRRHLFPGKFNNGILYKQICTLGFVPLDMIRNSRFAHKHFAGSKFIRKTGIGGQNHILKAAHQFYKNNILRDTIKNKYLQEWSKGIPLAQKDEEIYMIDRFCCILQEMLEMHPNNRPSIECVIARLGLNI